MKKRTVYLVLLVVATLLVMTAICPTPAHAQTVTVTSAGMNKYVGVDGGEFYKHPVVQSNVNLEAGPCFGNVWNSTGFNSRKEFDKEVDLTAGCSGKAGAVHFGTEVSYFFVQGVDIVAFAADMSLGPVFTRVEAYQPRKAGGPREGIMEIVGLRTGFSMGEHVKWSLEGNFRHDSGAFGFDKADLAQARAGVGVSFGKITLNAGVRYSKPLTAVTDGRKKEVVYESGLSFPVFSRK